ncbi:MAG: hypothetical protein J7K12_01050 [Thermoplasmata archaeon]|jgi:tRNA threonylcarbamoyladenosine modification (KEOPS) complex  Pcc1 subunit|nr:hypothetical protein [Thermoplasmata archaeon]
MHRAEIKVKENAEILYNALKYEEAPRCRTKFELEDGKLTITIEAKSVSNLRAALNSFLRWIDMLEKLMAKIK